MRMIDADNIYNVGDFVILHEDGNAYVPLADLCKIIDIQPTVYDVDKVVEQLEETKAYMLYENMNADVKWIDKAIEIVKAGGKNDNNL